MCFVGEGFGFGRPLWVTGRSVRELGEGVLLKQQKYLFLDFFFFVAPFPANPRSQCEA